MDNRRSTKKQDSRPHRKTPGPEADRLKLDGDWKEATKKALAKERPPEGWPNPEEMQANEKGQETPPGPAQND